MTNFLPWYLYTYRNILQVYALGLPLKQSGVTESCMNPPSGDYSPTVINAT
jgi:hypothetical protein